MGARNGRKRVGRGGGPAGRLHHPGAGGEGGRLRGHWRRGQAPGALGGGAGQRRGRIPARPQAAGRRPLRPGGGGRVDDHRVTDAPPDGAAGGAVDLSAVGPPALVVGPTPMGRQVLRLVWPVLVQQLLTLSVTFWDRFLSGQFLEPAAQAALTTATYLAWF